MNVKITPHTMSGEITAPPSKSYAHRLIIGAFLSGEDVVIHGAGTSADVTATLTALSAMGADVRNDGGTVYVGKRRPINTEITANCLESGSTLRFLYPVAAALGLTVTFTGSARLMERPMGEIAECLRGHGVTADGHRVEGKLTSGDYVINAGVSSQYITGLMLALPMLDGDSKIILAGRAVSRGYLDITLDVLDAFGIKIEKTDYGYFVPGGQRYLAKGELKVEGDWSGAAFMLTAGALGGPVVINGLRPVSAQGDQNILNVLARMGAYVCVHGYKTTVAKAPLRATDCDCSDFPDLVQTISVLCAFCEGESVLRGVDRLRIKESDRIEAIIGMLTRAGISAWYHEDSLHIVGGQPKGAVHDGGNDHRTVMSQAILCAYANGESEITGAEAVKKSYVSFDDFVALGGVVNE